MVLLVDKWCILVRYGAVKPTKAKKKHARGPELLALAEAAPRVVRAKDFLPAVDMLRLKGYSWRACAEWLEENAGIKVDHSSLLRISENRERFDDDDE